MFETNEVAICTTGLNEGKKFIIKQILADGSYSCIREDGENDRLHRYTGTSLKKADS